MKKRAIELTPGDKVWGAIVTGRPVFYRRWLGLVRQVEIPAVYVTMTDDGVWYESNRILVAPARMRLDA